MATAFLTMGCDKDRYCPSILITSVGVEVVGADGRTIDSVTFENNGAEGACEPSPSDEDGGDPTFFSCYTGSGLFTIRVTIGTQTWTETVTVARDECNVISESVTVDVSAAP